VKTHGQDKEGKPLCGPRHSGPFKKPLTFDLKPTCYHCNRVLLDADRDARQLKYSAQELRTKADALDAKAELLKKQQKEAWELGYRPSLETV
jgi:hypothetical protein